MANGLCILAASVYTDIFNSQRTSVYRIGREIFNAKVVGARVYPLALEAPWYRWTDISFATFAVF
jgi:hypothetical protein